MDKLTTLLSLARANKSSWLHDVVTSVLALAIIFLLGSCATNCGCGASQPHLTLGLGPEWTCAVDKAEHICKPTDGSKDRLIIWTLKDKGATDSFERYRVHLSEPLNKNGINSQPLSLKEIELNGTPWIDAVQKDSELKGFTTRYLTTIDQELAVLVTFSARTASFDKFSADMQPTIDRLVVRR